MNRLISRRLATIGASAVAVAAVAVAGEYERGAKTPTTEVFIYGKPQWE